jgi:hypothetical protein
MNSNIEIYGSDLDGNRGIAMKNFTLSTFNEDEILEQLYPEFLDGFTTGKRIVFIYNEKSDSELEIEVHIEDYFKELLEMAKSDETLENDLEIQEWLNSL